MNRREVLTGMSFSAVVLVTKPTFAEDALPMEWDLRDLYENDGAWTAALDAAEAQVAKLGAFETGFARSPHLFGYALTAISQATGSRCGSRRTPGCRPTPICAMLPPSTANARRHSCWRAGRIDGVGGPGDPNAGAREN
ncbi:hypothetical protein [Polymorphobacter megasporae]|uniref:hypothetical protein n=1 Tax=Glacieibacterium megasporae TaxID=2835787 RepID=UPI001C1E2128|nr:hypothetical protein [Polymorphobacter megasporae]UAJ08912.1 hypothetical protein KTC28_11070 [Polymorphobacter megasporae]